MATKIDYDAIEKSTIYDIRMDFVDAGKETFTLSEILELLDNKAREIRKRKEKETETE